MAAFVEEHLLLLQMKGSAKVMIQILMKTCYISRATLILHISPLEEIYTTHFSLD